MEANIIDDCELRDYRNRYRQYNWRDTFRYFFDPHRKLFVNSRNAGVMKYFLPNIYRETLYNIRGHK